MEPNSSCLTRHPSSLTRRPSCQSGFTLIEIMIGLVIGMLLTLVIIQVMSVFEAQTRTTAGTADAQTNGSIALYTISRELQMTGYGLLPVTNSALECTTLTVNGAADTPTTLSPLTITGGTTAAGDTLTLRYSTGTMGGVPTQIAGVGAPTANDLTVGTNFGCQVGDISLVTNVTTCAMSTVSAVSAAAAVPITVRLADITGAATKANLACLGTWNQVTFAVNGENLTRNGVPILPSVVSLHAQYGISATTGSNQITAWVEPTGATWAAPTVANRNRIKAIRLAVVARNAKAEMGDVTTACSSTTTASPTGLCAWAGTSTNPAPTIDLSADPLWQRYRYRVFETIIPLRNVIWAGATL